MVMRGTSMATPHVAGMAALLLQAKPDATVAELEEAILLSCELPQSMLQARGNRGIPDAERALAELVGPSAAQGRAARPKPPARRRKPAPRRKRRKI
jgi:subtilisin family serine protease